MYGSISDMEREMNREIENMGKNNFDSADNTPNASGTIGLSTPQNDGSFGNSQQKPSFPPQQLESIRVVIWLIRSA